MKKNSFPWPMKVTFVDVEIPNIKNDSVCAISVIVVENGSVVLRHTELINPRSFFSGVNVSIHHITPQQVQNKRSFKEFWLQYSRYFSSEYIIAGHNVLSDINVMDRDLKRYGLSLTPGFYIDTMDLALEEFYKNETQKGDLKLNRICEKMNIEIDHHNPQSDVNACYEMILYLNRHGLNSLQPYIKEMRMKQKPETYSPMPVRNITTQKYYADIASRDFKPYFAVFEPLQLTYQPYFDRVMLADLKKVYIPETALEKFPELAREEQKIRDYVESIGGTVYSKDQMKEALCVVEFLIPKPQAFIYYKRRGLKLFHSLDILNFIEMMQAEENADSIMFASIVTENRSRILSTPLSEQPSIEDANELGLDAYRRRDLNQTVYYYEISVAKNTANIRVYRQLADLYHKYSLFEEEARVLKKGIRVCKRKRKDSFDLQKRLDRIKEHLKA